MEHTNVEAKILVAIQKENSFLIKLFKHCHLVEKTEVIKNRKKNTDSVSTKFFVLYSHQNQSVYIF